MGDMGAEVENRTRIPADPITGTYYMRIELFDKNGPTKLLHYTAAKQMRAKQNRVVQRLCILMKRVRGDDWPWIIWNSTICLAVIQQKVK